MGGAGIGAAVGSNILLRKAFGQSTPVGGSSLSPNALKFSITSQYRPFDVISKNFVEHSDGFDTNGGLYTTLAPVPPNKTGSVSIGGGVLSVARDNKFFALFRTAKSPVAPYASVIVDVRSYVGSARSDDTVYAGLVKDASNYVAAWYNNATKKVGIDAVVGGESQQVGREGRYPQGAGEVRLRAQLQGGHRASRHRRVNGHRKPMGATGQLS